MTGLLLFFAGALAGGVTAWGLASSRSADQVVALQVENALLREGIAQGDAAFLAEHHIDSTRVADDPRKGGAR